MEFKSEKRRVNSNELWREVKMTRRKLELLLYFPEFFYRSYYLQIRRTVFDQYTILWKKHVRFGSTNNYCTILQTV